MGSDRVVDLATINLGEFFAENEPFYLSIGMSHEGYWNGEPSLARTTLRAFNLTQQREMQQLNYSNWLLGSYIESAVASVANNILGKENKYKSTYIDKPFPLFEEDKIIDEEKEKEEAKKKVEMWLRDVDRQLSKKFKQ